MPDRTTQPSARVVVLASALMLGGYAAERVASRDTPPRGPIAASDEVTAPNAQALAPHLLVPAQPEGWAPQCLAFGGADHLYLPGHRPPGPTPHLARAASPACRPSPAP